MTHTPSFLRTDKAIMLAFMRLMEKKPFEKITVQNILDETPVTRGTFYAHYKDKYEIAEKMLAMYMEERQKVRNMTYENPSYVTNDRVLKTSPGFYTDLGKTLTKIHTEEVNFRHAIAEDYAMEYLQEKEHTEKTIMESRLYAQLRTEMAFFILEENKEIPVKDFREIMYNVSDFMQHKFKLQKKPK